MVYIPGTAECGLKEGFRLGYTADGLRGWDKETFGFEPDENEHWPEGEPGVTIAGFWLAAYPVTVAQFEPFCAHVFPDSGT